MSAIGAEGNRHKSVAVVMDRSVQLGTSWYNKGEVYVFGESVALSLFSHKSAHPYISTKPKAESFRDSAENRQIAMRPKLTRGSVVKDVRK